MLGLLLRSRLAAFAIALAGVVAMLVGGWRWIGPLPGPPVGASLAGFTEVQSVDVRAGGEPTVTLPLTRSDGSTWRVVVSGGLQFEHTGELLPADLLATGGPTGRPLLRLARAAPTLLGKGGAGWVLAPGALDGEGLQLRVDTDPLVEQYLLNPSQALAALDGAVTVSLWRRQPPARGPMAGGPYWALGMLLVAFGTAMGVVGGRVRRAERSPVLTTLDRIEARIASLLEAIDPHDLGAASLIAGLERARREARSLAEGIERRGRMLADLGPDVGEEVAPLREAIRGAARALEAIDRSVGEAATHVRAREAAAAALDVEAGVATSLAARAALATQVEALREADAELGRLEGRAPQWEGH